MPKFCVLLRLLARERYCLIIFCLVVLMFFLVLVLNLNFGFDMKVMLKSKPLYSVVNVDGGVDSGVDGDDNKNISNISSCFNQSKSSIEEILHQGLSSKLTGSEVESAALTKASEVMPKINLKLKKGQNLSGLLKKYGLTHQDIYNIGELLEPYISPKDFQVGHEIEIAVTNDGLISVELNWEFAKKIFISRSGSEWSLHIKDTPTSIREYYIEGVVSYNLYQSALTSGLSPDAIKQLVTAYSYSVDFKRNIKPGDRFKVLYSERYIVGRPELARFEKITYAELTLSGNVKTLMSYLGKIGVNLFYDLNGKVAGDFLMKTPVPGARLTSYFGRRFHPMLGYTRLHNGLDFGAPMNTPVLATGHGVVEDLGYKGTFGKRIKIKHNNGFHTLYAHLNGFAKGVARGDQVQQGDVIGYLGNTGLSRARHLHYEVHRNGRAVDPLTLKQVATRRLEGSDLADFNQVKRRLMSRLALYQSNYTLSVAI